MKWENFLLDTRLHLSLFWWLIYSSTFHRTIRIHQHGISSRKEELKEMKETKKSEEIKWSPWKGLKSRATQQCRQWSTITSKMMLMITRLASPTRSLYYLCYAYVIRNREMGDLIFSLFFFRILMLCFLFQMMMRRLFVVSTSTSHFSLPLNEKKTPITIFFFFSFLWSPQL